MVHDPRHLEVIVSIDESRRAIASLFGRSGLEEPRRRLLESHIRMLERLSEHAGADPAIGLLAALARLDLAPDDRRDRKAPRRDPEIPGQWTAPGTVRSGRWRSWIANDVHPYPSGPNPTGESQGRLDPDAHAHAVIRALESRCEALGVDPALLPAAAFQVAGIAACRAAEQRKAGRLDDARQTAACLSAFAKTLARRDPNEAAFHLVLCMAFEQESKNAWQVEDYATIEDALRKALGEACTALRLDPRNAEARLSVAGLQDKLVALDLRKEGTGARNMRLGRHGAKARSGRFFVAGADFGRRPSGTQH